jgi:hypothetical protein
MKYRAFRKTGLEVSEVVFGGGCVGGILIDPDDETKREALRRTIAVGVLVTETRHGREIQITGSNGELAEELAQRVLQTLDMNADQLPPMAPGLKL